MVLLRVRKKKTLRALSSKVDQRPNQLLETVSPFEEMQRSHELPVHFMKTSKFNHRHGYASEQLAKSKTKHAVEESRCDSVLPDELLAGIVTAPARAQPEIADASERIRAEVNEPNSKESTLSPTCHKRANCYMPFFRPPLIPTLRSPKPSLEGPAAMRVPTTADHEIPFIISITRLDEDENNDASSDISLEDVLTYNLRANTEVASNKMHSNSKPVSTYMPSFVDTSCPTAMVPTMKTYFPITAGDLNMISDNSITWPSDEEDSIESEKMAMYSERNNIPRQQMMIAAPDMNRGDGYSRHLPGDTASGGFKFWSTGEIHTHNLMGNQVSNNENASAARDEENSRDVNEKAREEASDIPATAAHV